MHSLEATPHRPVLRRGSLESRVARIEAQLAEPPASDLPLSRHEQRELAELEHERRERFSKPIDSMDLHELADFQAWSCSDGGQAARLDQLRERARGWRRERKHRS